MNNPYTEHVSRWNKREPGGRMEQRYKLKEDYFNKFNALPAEEKLKEARRIWDEYGLEEQAKAIKPETDCAFDVLCLEFNEVLNEAVGDELPE